jgi:hypothetical protein
VEMGDEDTSNIISVKRKGHGRKDFENGRGTHSPDI